MADSKLSLLHWEKRVGELPPLVNLLAYDLHLDGRAPANAVAEAVRTLDLIGMKGRTQTGSKLPYRTQHACRDAVSDFRAMTTALAEAKGSLAKASTPEPWSTSKTSNWVARGGGLPDYIQHVSHGIKRSNPALSTSEAIARAIGVVKDWARGGKHVDAETRAAAAKAVAEWEALKAKQHAKSAAKGAKAATEAATEDGHRKLLAAASRMAHVLAPLPNQATFAIRYGNRMARFEGVLGALRDGKPLAVQAAREILDAPEGLPLDYLVEEFVERKQQTLILMEALGYSSTPIRARHGKKGSFHGMHGHERAVKKRKLIPETPEHPVADVLVSGGKLDEAAPPVAPAAGAVPFDPGKHPRQAGGKFGQTGGQPAADGAGGGAGTAHNGNAVATAIQAADPQFQKEMAQTSAYAKEHPLQAPQAGDQLQSIGYSNDPHGIVQFQKDNGLPTTGKLDAATAQVVASSYGSRATMAPGMKADISGIASGGAAANAPPSGKILTTAGTTVGGGKGGTPKPPGPSTLGPSSPKKVNEALRDALAEALGDAPNLLGTPSDADRDDFDLDEPDQVPPNLRIGDPPTVCMTCAHFSPKGWVTRRSVQGACLAYSTQVDKDQVCDDYLTLSPPDMTLRVWEAKLDAATESGDGSDIVAARAALKAVKARPDVQKVVLREAEAVEAFRIMESADGIVEGADLSTAGRAAMAKKKTAMADGSWPIPNTAFLKKAIQALGRGKKSSVTVKAWIIKRAKALGATGMLPDDWNVS